MNDLETKPEKTHSNILFVLKLLFYSIVLASAVVLFFALISFKYGFLGFIIMFYLWFVYIFATLFISLAILADKRKKRFLLPLFCILLIILIYFLLISEWAISFLEWLNPFFLLIYFPIILLILSWLLLVIFTKKLKEPAYSRISFIALHGFVFLIIFVVVFLAGDKVAKHRANLFVEKTKQKAQIIIDKLETHHQTHNSYPETLEEVGISEDLCKLSEINSKFMYWKKPETFIIEFAHPLGFMNYWTYSPETKEWFLD